MERSEAVTLSNLAWLDQQGYPVRVGLTADREAIKQTLAAWALVLQTRAFRKSAGFVCDAIHAIGDFNEPNNPTTTPQHQP